jgi:hypothetical protein
MNCKTHSGCLLVDVTDAQRSKIAERVHTRDIGDGLVEITVLPLLVSALCTIGDILEVEPLEDRLIARRLARKGPWLAIQMRIRDDRAIESFARSLAQAGASIALGSGRMVCAFRRGRTEAERNRLRDELLAPVAKAVADGLLVWERSK